MTGLPVWLIEVVAALAIVGGGLGWFAHHERGIELAKLQKSSTELIAKAQKTIAQETAQHALDNANNQGKLNEQLKTNAILGSALDSRVRDFESYRRAHSNLPRPASGSAPAGSGECGSLQCGDLAVQLAELGNKLARSDGDLSAALSSCQRDRDSLTGH